MTTTRPNVTNYSQRKNAAGKWEMLANYDDGSSKVILVDRSKAEISRLVRIYNQNH